MPKTANILNMTLSDKIDGLMNGSSTNYKPRKLIPITSFLVRSVFGVIESPHGDMQHHNSEIQERNKGL